MRFCYRTALASVVVAATTAAGVASAAAGPAQVPPGYTTLADETGAFTVAVPATWTQTLTSPSTGDDGVTTARIIASPDAQAFVDGQGSGVLLVGLSVGIDPQTALPDLQADLSAGCAGIPTTAPFQSAAFSGLVATWTQCPVPGGERHGIVARATGRELTVVGHVNVVPADGVTGTTIAGMLALGGAAPTASTVPPVTASTVPPVTASTVPPVTASTVPPVTASTVPVAPTTGPGGITVLSAGDPATLVNLRVPFAVGQRGASENFSRIDGTITASGVESFTTQWQYSESEVGVDEVLVVNPDGSFQLRYTPSSIEISETYSNSEISQSGPDRSLLEGVPLIVTYGADRLSTNVVAETPAALTADQQTLVADLSFSMPGYAFPATPVGTGATWTAEAPATFEGDIESVPATFQLVSVTGDQYTVNVTWTLDRSTVPVTGYAPGVTSATGTISGTATITGSLSNPMTYHLTVTERVQSSTTYSDGITLAVDANVQQDFEERAA